MNHSPDYGSRNQQKHKQSVSSGQLRRRKGGDILDGEAVADNGTIRPTDYQLKRHDAQYGNRNQSTSVSCRMEDLE